MKKHLLIGGSVAGTWAAETIRKYNQEDEITILSDEPETFYSRCLLPAFLEGKISLKNITLRDKLFYEKKKINFRGGVKAIKVIPNDNTVIAENGEKFIYDDLLIGTGASPMTLNVKGEDSKGIYGLRNFNDARMIDECIRDGKRAVVVGGGLVSLKSACMFLYRGLEVTVLVTSKSLLSQMLDEESANIFYKRISAQKGIKIMFERSVKEFISTNGRVSKVITDKGEELPADVVVVGKGVKPNIDFLKDSGIKTDWGIPVNDYLQTNIENIYASGDVAETRQALTGKMGVSAIWPAAAEQGKIVGYNMVHNEKRTYRGSYGMNSVEFFGLPVIFVGSTVYFSKSKCPDCETLVNEKQRDDFYQKIVIKDGHIVSAVLVGDVGNAGIILEAIRQKTPVNEIKDRIFKRIETVNAPEASLKLYTW